MEGWIKLHRKVLENPLIMKDKDYLAVWIYLLLNATHKEYDVLFEGKRIALKEGQLIMGRKSVSEKLKVDESKVQRILKSFENEHQIEQQTTSRNRLVSIVNWNEYQQNEQQIEQQVNNNCTTDEQQMNTNKNVKNNKNVKEIKGSKKKDKEKETFDELIESYTSNSQLRDELKNHLAVRKQKKGALTNRAIELSLKELDKLTSKIPVNDVEKIDKTKIEIVQQSILKGWIGFFEVKDTISWKAKDKNKNQRTNNIFADIGREEGIFG